MEQEKNHQLDGKLIIALTIYLASLFAANTLGLKTMPFLFGTHLSVSVFFFPFVFIMTDIIGEVYGKKMARRFVVAGFLSIVLFLLYSLISAIFPWSEKSMWAHNSYNQIFGISARIAIASLVAFAIAEYQDVLAFFFFRRKIGTKLFGLRSILSNLWSQLLDTTIFMSVAFLGFKIGSFEISGIYSLQSLPLLIIPWWLYKVAMGALYLPLSYLGLRLLRGKSVSTPTFPQN